MKLNKKERYEYRPDFRQCVREFWNVYKDMTFPIIAVILSIISLIFSIIYSN